MNHFKVGQMLKLFQDFIKSIQAKNVGHCLDSKEHYIYFDSCHLN